MTDHDRKHLERQPEKGVPEDRDPTSNKLQPFIRRTGTESFLGGVELPPAKNGKPILRRNTSATMLQSDEKPNAAILEACNLILDIVRRGCRGEAEQEATEGCCTVADDEAAFTVLVLARFLRGLCDCSPRDLP